MKDISRVVKSLGGSIVAYILNLDVAEVERLFNNEIELDAKRQRTFDEYVKVVESSNLNAARSGRASSYVSSYASHLTLNERHKFSIWREQNGGVLPKLDGGDSLEDVMSRIAVEYYGVLLLEMHSPRSVGDPRIFRSSSLPLLGHSNACAAILSDDDFSKIFAHRGDGPMDTYGENCDNAGIGRIDKLHLFLFPGMILWKSYELMGLHGEESPEAFVAYTRKVVEMIRTVVRTGSVRLPKFVGVQNVAFDGEFEIETVYGKFVKCSPTMQELLPAGVMAVDRDGRYTTVILESDYEYRVRFFDDDVSPREPIPYINWFDDSKPIVEDLSTAFSLAVNRDVPVGANCRSVYAFRLFGHSSAILWNDNLRFPVPAYSATREDMEKVAEWCKRIHDADDDKIRIAIRRALSSIGTRSNSVDGFVDAMIALECLFGGHAEVTLRVSVAVAKLLHPGGPDRDKCKKTVSDLYSDRSKIVHGSKEWNSKEAYEKWKVTIGIVLECLRKLYTEHPNLIADLERSTKILLS